MDSDAIELLKQIVENTKSDHGWILPVIGAIAVMISAAIPSLFALRQMGKRIEADMALKEKEYRATIIASERIKWLEKLRGLAGEFYTNLDLQFGQLGRQINALQNPQFQGLLDGYFEKTTLLANQIILHINAEKKEQARLKIAVDGALAIILQTVALRNQNNFSFPRAQYTANKQDFFSAMQDVCKETWRQTKGLS